jgi:penicillin-binding protein 1A
MLFLWRMIWAVLWRVTVVAVLIYGGIVFYFYQQLPDVNALLDGRARGSVTLLDRNGKVFAWRGETFGGQITAETVSPYLLHAVVATEDKRFYRHFGIIAARHRQRHPHQPVRGPRRRSKATAARPSPSRWRSFCAWACPMTRHSGNPRPITNPTAAAAACGARSRKCPSPWRWRLKYSKEEILTIYFNRAYLGAGARGFEAAAQRYFGKSAAERDPGRGGDAGGPSEGAVDLCAHRNLQRARDRANVVIGLMEEQGYLTAAEAEEARANPAELSQAARQKSGGFFADWVMETTPDYLARDTTEDVIIETTLDQKMQAQAEEALKWVFENKVKAGSKAQAAIVVMSADGAVRAMVGGRDLPQAGDFNRATQALRQTGSASSPSSMPWRWIWATARWIMSTTAPGRSMCPARATTRPRTMTASSRA